MRPRHRRSTLFPYTTLFRSNPLEGMSNYLALLEDDVRSGRTEDALDLVGHVREGLDRRSEEHTSELQSRLHLVCRLLLEKKKRHPARRLAATHTRSPGCRPT